MTKIILHGCNGRMGQMLTGLLKEDPEAEVVAGVDGYTGIANNYPVFTTIDECDVQADVVIDFSNAKAADGLLDYCVRTKTPVVLCTTGLSEEQLVKVEEAAKETAVLKSANMSLGINPVSYTHLPVLKTMQSSPYLMQYNFIILYVI